MSDPPQPPPPQEMLSCEAKIWAWGRDCRYTTLFGWPKGGDGDVAPGARAAQHLHAQGLPIAPAPGACRPPVDMLHLVGHRAPDPSHVSIALQHKGNA